MIDYELNNIKVIVFGSSGLVGSSLVEKLLKFRLDLFLPYQ